MPHTPFQFPCVTLQELRRFCPSKQHGKLWKNELAFRDDCIDVIERTCAALAIASLTQERAVILMHRYFSTTSSAQCTGLAKWVHTVACLYIVLKADSVYHRLDSIVHSAIVELRKMQQRQMEPEYFNPDGTPGNANYLAKLAELVVQAEMDVLLSVNFAIDIRVPTGQVGHYMQKLNLTEEAEMQHPEVAAKINAVRREAVQITHACCGKGTVVVLLHPPEHLAMAALYTACKANNLQWYLGPPEADRKEQEAVAAMQGHARVLEELKNQQKGERVPDLPLARLKAIAADLPAVPGMGSALTAEPQDNDGHGCFRSRGGRWLGKRASRPALVKYEGGIRLSSNATDSSNGEAATGLPRLCDPSPSPDSANGPSSAAQQQQQPGGSGSGGSSRSQARHVSFGALPPSVALLQAQFRQQRAQEEKYRRERSPEPCASLDSDLQDLQDPLLLGSGPAGQETREQQRQALCGQLKRSRDESVGLAAGSDEEDSAMSRPAAKEQGVEADSAGSNKRARVAVAGSSA